MSLLLVGCAVNIKSFAADHGKRATLRFEWKKEDGSVQRKEEIDVALKALFVLVERRAA